MSAGGTKLVNVRIRNESDMSESDIGESNMNETIYEDRLGDALEKLLDEGADDLEALAAGLNRLGVAPPSGTSWNAGSLEAEFKRLAPSV